MATCMAVLLPYPRRKVGLEDTRSRGRRRQEQLVGPIPTPFRRRVADLAPRHRPVLSFHDPLRQGKTPRKRQRLLWIEGSEPAAVPGSRTVPGGPPGSGRIYGLCTDHLDQSTIIVARGPLPAHAAALSDDLQMAVPLRRCGLRGFTGHRVRAGWYDHGRLGMLHRDLGVNVVAVVRTVASERRQWPLDLLEQSVDLRAVVSILV